MIRFVTTAVLLLVVATGAQADLTNPSTLKIEETAPSRFTVELTLPLIKGRVLKARPVLPDICVIEGEPEVRGDNMKVVRTWQMHCDPDALVGKAIGVQGLLGTAQDVQLTLSTLDGRTYVSQLRPTQAYFLVPPAPTIGRMAADIGGAAARAVLRCPELLVLMVLLVFSGIRLPGLFAAAGAFAAAPALGQWLESESLLQGASVLPPILTAALGLVTAVRILDDEAAASPAGRRTLAVLLTAVGLLYGSSGLPVAMVLSRSEQHLAFLFSALGTLAGLVPAILWAHQLRALLAGLAEGRGRRLSCRIAWLGGVAACAIGLYHAGASLLMGGVAPIAPYPTMLGAVAIGAWCGARTTPVRALLPGVAGGAVILGLALSLNGIDLPRMTPALYGSLAVLGLLMVRPVRLPTWSAPALVAVSSLTLGVHAGGFLVESTVLPAARATAMMVLLVFLFLGARRLAGLLGPGAVVMRVLGSVTVVSAVVWRFAEYREWLGGEVAVAATMGLFQLPVLTIVLLLAALLMWPRKRRFQAAAAGTRPALHWGLVMVALFTVPVGGCAVRNPFHTPSAPSAVEARPIMDMLLSDTYLAFNLTDEDAAFDRLAHNLAEDLVAGVYLDSRRRLTAGTREGAEVTVRDVRVVSVDAPRVLDATAQSFAYPCKWVVTARVKHWQHIHDRLNIYVGELALRVEDRRWKIAHLELFNEEREILSWKNL